MGRVTKRQSHRQPQPVFRLGINQERPLLRSGISVACSLPGSGPAAAGHPAALLVRRCQKRALLPTGDFMLEQECQRVADSSMIPLAPLDLGSLESILALL